MSDATGVLCFRGSLDGVCPVPPPCLFVAHTPNSEAKRCPPTHTITTTTTTTTTATTATTATRSLFKAWLVSWCRFARCWGVDSTQQAAGQRADGLCRPHACIASDADSGPTCKWAAVPGAHPVSTRLCLSNTAAAPGAPATVCLRLPPVCACLARFPVCTGRTVVVENLPPNTSIDQTIERFAPCGTVRQLAPLRRWEGGGEWGGGGGGLVAPPPPVRPFCVGC